MPFRAVALSLVVTVVASLTALQLGGAQSLSHSAAVPTTAPAPAPALEAKPRGSSVSANALHASYVVETNASGKVIRVATVAESTNASFNQRTYGMARQTIIRQPGTYKLTYDYHPRTKQTTRSVSLLLAQAAAKPQSAARAAAAAPTPRIVYVPPPATPVPVPNPPGNVSESFAKVRPAVVQIWAFDERGSVISASSGIILASTGDTSLLLTAAHGIDNASKITVDVNAAVNSLPATVLTKDSLVAVLRVPHGNLATATLSKRAAVVGDAVAAAGYVIPFRTNPPQVELHYPGTVTLLIQNGSVIAFQNLNVDSGMSGAPLFDPTSGNVVGIVESKSTDASSGGYAVSISDSVLRYLNQHNITYSSGP